MWTSTAARLTRLPSVVTAADLRAAAVDPDVARRAAASGAWRDVLPGAWLRSERDVVRRDRQEGALAVLGGGAMLTGADACLLHGLRDVPDDGRVSCLVPAELQRDLGSGVRLLRTGDLPRSLLVRGLAAAPPARAVLDAARGWRSLQDVRALVLAAVADGWCDPVELLTALDAGPRRGSGHCRRALADALAGAASAPEAEVADAVRRVRGLPEVVLNPEVWLDGRFLGKPDGYVRGTGVGWEVDSVRHHGGANDLDATLRRHEDFGGAGLSLLHVTPRRFRYDPAAFVAALCGRVAQRQDLLVPEPPGLVLVVRR